MKGRYLTGGRNRISLEIQVKNDLREDFASAVAKVKPGKAGVPDTPPIEVPDFWEVYAGSEDISAFFYKVVRVYAPTPITSVEIVGKRKEVWLTKSGVSLQRQNWINSTRSLDAPVIEALNKVGVYSLGPDYSTLYTERFTDRMCMDLANLCHNAPRSKYMWAADDRVALMMIRREVAKVVKR